MHWHCIMFLKIQLVHLLKKNLAQHACCPMLNNPISQGFGGQMEREWCPLAPHSLKSSRANNRVRFGAYNLCPFGHQKPALWIRSEPLEYLRTGFEYPSGGFWWVAQNFGYTEKKHSDVFAYLCELELFCEMRSYYN